MAKDKNNDRMALGMAPGNAAEPPEGQIDCFGNAVDLTGARNGCSGNAAVPLGTRNGCFNFLSVEPPDARNGSYEPRLKSIGPWSIVPCFTWLCSSHYARAYVRAHTAMYMCIYEIVVSYV